MKKIIRNIKEKLNLDFSQDSSKFLTLLISADMAFILIHVVYLFYNPRGFNVSVWSLEVDRGISEAYQYVKEFWLVLMLGQTAITHYRAYLLSWAALFLYVLADDAFRFHEICGEFLARVLNLPTNILRSTDYGEVLFFIIAGVIFLIAIGLTYYRNRKDEVLRSINKHLICFLFVLAAFGVIADSGHILVLKAAKAWSWPQPLTIVLFFLSGIIEDGGEMITLSITAWYVFTLTGRLNKNLSTNKA
ncbi:MAG: hypothetical protein ABIG64_07350 [Candidatus Omnitrophota bacterium]